MLRMCVLSLTVLMAGCTTVVPVRQHFPDAVPELLKACPELKQYTGPERSITELLKVVVENYTTYYDCANRVEGWREWYTTQKKIFDEVNKK